jgi:RND family efflux transporter MFP subunit
MRFIHHHHRWSTWPHRCFLALAWVAQAGLLGLVAGCQRPPQQQPAAAEAPKAEPPKVTVVRPERKAVRRAIKRPGYNIEAYQSTPLYPRITGYVSKWNVDIGSPVSRDMVLAELSVPEMEVELRQKEAAVAQAEAEIPQARSALLRAQAEQDRTKSQYERLAKIGRNGVIDPESVEEARFGFAAAQAGVAKAQADVKVAEERLRVVQRAQDYTRTLLQYAKIRAPFDGVITQRNVSEGDFVQPIAGKKGEAMFVVDQVDPVRVFVHVPEGEAVWIRDGLAASVRSQSLPGWEFKGTVTRTARSLSPATRTLRTEIDLPNLQGKLIPGMYVDVTLVVEHKDVWTLPASAVLTEEDQPICYRQEVGKAIRTPLRVGLRGDGLVEVLKKQVKGSDPGTEGVWEDFTGKEEVISSGVAGLKDGQRVSVTSGGK